MRMDQIFICENNWLNQVENNLEYNPWKDYTLPPPSEPVIELTSETEGESNSKEWYENKELSETQLYHLKPMRLFCIKKELTLL